MTANYKLDSMFELRKYLWQQLLSNNIFDDSEYYSDNLGESINPIIPVQQSAEMSQFLSGKKHIVYDKIGISYDEIWAICTEQVLFTIYSTEIMDIVEIKNFMVDLFRRMDESAQDVNRWSGLSDKFKFHSIYISDMSPTAPSEQMKGFLSSDIVLEVKYSRMIGPNGRFL
jgi:hypothetical protein